MDKIKQLAEKLIGSEVIRYLFFGGCTTLVNYVVYYVFLRILHVDLNVSNLISIVAAVLFAYVVNSKYVFMDKRESLKDHLQPFLKFIGARAFSMIVELFGVWFLVKKLQMDEMVGKVITSIVVIILNYFFSKFFVFTKKTDGSEQKNTP